MIVLMLTIHTRLPVSVLVLLVVLTGACSSGEPLKVTSIQLGRSLNADNTVAGHTTVFEADDTVYLSVATSGTGSGSIEVHWKYGTRVLDRPKKQVTARGGLVTEFHLESSEDLWPGDYTVEVFLDGQSAGTRTFRVVRPS
jgi:hypothetical protein